MLAFWARLRDRWRVDPGALSLFCFALSFASLIVMSALRSVYPMPVLPMSAAWLMALGWFLMGAWCFDRLYADELRPLGREWTKVDLLIVALSLLVAIPLRFVSLDVAPLTIHNDEAVYVGNARALAGLPLADFAHLDTAPHTNLWYYVQLLGNAIFGDTLAGARSLSALFGIVTLPALYLLARLLFARRVAAIAVLLLATFHFHIHFSRVALNNITDPLFGALIFLCLVIGLRTQRLFFCALAGVIAGVSFYFYNGARLFAPLVAVMLLLWMAEQACTWRGWLQMRIWSPAVAVASGALMAAAPYIQNALADSTSFTMRYQRDGVTFQWLVEAAVQRNTTPVGVAGEQIVRGFLGFILYHDVDPAAFYDNTRPLLWGAAALCAVVGMFIVLRGWREWRYQLLIAWYGLAVIFGGVLMRNPPSVQRFVTLAPVFCLLMAIAVDAAMKFLSGRWPRRQTVVQIAALLLVIYMAFDSVAAYFWDYLPRETFGTVRSQRATALAYAMTPDAPRFTVYYVGPDADSLFYSAIPRLVHGDLDAHVWQGSLPEIDPTRATLFVAPPEDLPLLQEIERALPGGALTPIVWPKTGVTLLYVYRISPVPLSASQF